MGLKSNEIDPLLIRQLKQTANKPVTRLVLLTGFNTPPAPSPEGSQLQPVTKLITQLLLNIIFRCIDYPCAQSIFGCLVHIIYFQFAENIFAMGGDGVDAGETLGGNFFGRLA